VMEVHFKADQVGLEQAQCLDQELLPSLVAVQDYDGAHDRQS